MQVTVSILALWWLCSGKKFTETFREAFLFCRSPRKIAMCNKQKGLNVLSLYILNSNRLTSWRIVAGAICKRKVRFGENISSTATCSQEWNARARSSLSDLLHSHGWEWLEARDPPRASPQVPKPKPKYDCATMVWRSR